MSEQLEGRSPESSASSLGSPKIVLPLILLVAAILRFWAIDWHLPATLHPDEHNVVNTSLRFGTGDLNPHFFQYGSLYMYVTFVGYGIYYVLGAAIGTFPTVDAFAIEYFRDPTWFFLIPRMISAAAGVATVWFVYLAGRRFWSVDAGLIAAALVAVHLDHVIQSRYALPGALGVMLIAATLSRLFGKGTTTVAATFATAIVAGLAMSAHVLAVVAPLTLGLVILFRNDQNPLNLIRLEFVAVFGTFVGLFIGEPYLFLDFDNASYQLFGWTDGLFQSLFASIPLSWVAREQTAAFPRGLGLLGVVLMAVGVLFAVVRRPRDTAAICLGVAAFGALLLSRHVTEGRYILMVMPLACLLAGVGAACLMQYATQLRREATGLISLAAVLAVIAQPAIASVKQVADFGKPDTRVLAARWVHEHLPTDSRLLLDGEDATLPPLRENQARAEELQRQVEALDSVSNRFTGLADYFRFKALAAAAADEPTYWILRRKSPWWLGSEDELASSPYNNVPPTTHLGVKLRLADYRRDYDIDYVISTSVQLRAYDNDRYPSTHRFFEDLRRDADVVYVQEPAEGIKGPRVIIWRVGDVRPAGTDTPRVVSERRPAK